MKKALPFKIAFVLGVFLALAFAAPGLSVTNGLVTGSPDWRWVNPSYQGNTIKSLSFPVDDQNGWAAGIGGTILHTTNGGGAWSTQIPSIMCGSVNGGGCNLTGINFVDNNNGWVVGDYGTIWKTANGGSNWTSLNANLPAAYRTSDLRDVSFVNAQTGILVIDSVQTTHNQNGIDTYVIALLTTNGGTSWIPVTMTSTSGSYSYSGQMVSSTSAVVVGSAGKILKIDYSGSAWVVTASSSGSGADLKSVYCTAGSSAYNCWAVGGGYILRSLDSGVTWTKNTSAMTPNLWGVTYAPGSNTLVVTGDTGTIKTRTNANNVGTTPDTVDTIVAGLSTASSGTTSQLLAVTFAGSSSTIGYASGNAGAITKTIDGGANWSLDAGGNEKSYSGSSFIDHNTGWMVAMNGTVDKTIDAGQNWVSDGAGITAGTNLQAVQFLNASTGFTVGYFGGAGVAYKYNSGTWSAMTVPAGVDSLWGVSMADATHGWAVGIPTTRANPKTGAGVVLKTTDGINWSYDASAASTIGNDVQLYGVSTIPGNINNVWLSGQRYGTGALCDPHNPSTCSGQGVLYKYNGSTWTESDKTDSTFFTSIDMTSANVGYAVGYFWGTPPTPAAGRGYKTTDGGATWSAMNMGTSKLMADVSFIDNSVGYVAGEDGRVMKTVNGGVSWVTQNLGTTVSMNTVSVVQNTFTPYLLTGDIYVGGANSSILHSTLSESTLMGSYDLGGIFFIDHDTGKRRGIASQNVFDNWGFDPTKIQWVNLATINQYPNGDVVTPLASHGGGVYLVQGQKFRPISDGNTFEIFKMNWGLDWGDIKPLSDGAFNAFNNSGPGDVITFPRLVTYSYGGPVYYMDNDGKRPIVNAPTLVHWFGNAAWSRIFYTKNNAFLAGYPSPAPWYVICVEKRSNGTYGGVWIISNQTRYAIPSIAVFNAHAAYDPVYNWANVYPCSTDTLLTLPQGPDIS